MKRCLFLSFEDRILRIEYKQEGFLLVKITPPVRISFWRKLKYLLGINQDCVADVVLSPRDVSILAYYLNEIDRELLKK